MNDLAAIDIALVYYIYSITSWPVSCLSLCQHSERRINVIAFDDVLDHRRLFGARCGYERVDVNCTSDFLIGIVYHRCHGGGTTRKTQIGKHTYNSRFESIQRPLKGLFRSPHTNCSSEGSAGSHVVWGIRGMTKTANHFAVVLHAVERSKG